MFTPVCRSISARACSRFAVAVLSSARNGAEMVPLRTRASSRVSSATTYLSWCRRHPLQDRNPSSPLFRQHSLAQVARMIHINPILHRHEVREELQRNHFGKWQAKPLVSSSHKTTLVASLRLPLVARVRDRKYVAPLVVMSRIRWTSFSSRNTIRCRSDPQSRSSPAESRH